MPSKKLSIKTTSDIFGTKVNLELSDGSKSFLIGQNIQYDPTARLVKSMKTGYLFRSPSCDPADLCNIWDTIEGFTGKSHLSAEYDGKTENLTVYIRIAEKGDATMFAFSHNTFEKWSDEKEADARARAKEKKKAVIGKVNDDGTVRVSIETEVLGD